MLWGSYERKRVTYPDICTVNGRWYIAKSPHSIKDLSKIKIRNIWAMCQCTLLSNINIKQAKKSSIRVAKVVILMRGLRFRYSPSQENEKMRGACFLQTCQLLKGWTKHLLIIYFRHFLCGLLLFRIFFPFFHY